MMKLCISNNTFYRWRREIVKLVGSYLGWSVNETNLQNAIEIC